MKLLFPECIHVIIRVSVVIRKFVFHFMEHGARQWMAECKSNSKKQSDWTSLCSFRLVRWNLSQIYTTQIILNGEFPEVIPSVYSTEVWNTENPKKKKRWMFFSWRWSWVGKIAKCLLKTTFIFFNLTVAAALKSVASQLRKLEGIQWEKFHEKNATIYDITFCMHAWQSKYQVAKKPCEKRCFAHFHKNKHNYITIYTFYIFYIIII